MKSFTDYLEIVQEMKEILTQDRFKKLINEQANYISEALMNAGFLAESNKILQDKDYKNIYIDFKSKVPGGAILPTIAEITDEKMKEYWTLFKKLVDQIDIRKIKK